MVIYSSTILFFDRFLYMYTLAYIFTKFQMCNALSGDRGVMFYSLFRVLSDEIQRQHTSLPNY